MTFDWITFEFDRSIKIRLSIRRMKLKLNSEQEINEKYTRQTPLKYERNNHNNEEMAAITLKLF